MPRPSRTILILGPAGPVELLIDEPEELRGLALIAHPYPPMGGTNRNKVVHTLAHTLRDLGYLALRPNFRGVGKSAGKHDEGDGEALDLLAVLDFARKEWAVTQVPTVLAGFSFGAYVQTRVAKQMAERGQAVPRLLLVGLATGLVAGLREYRAESVPKGTVLIHGDRDPIVPLSNVQAYAASLGLEIHIVEGADHFFDGRLLELRAIVERALQPLLP